MNLDDEKILTKITTAIFKKAEEKHLNHGTVSNFVRDIHEAFHKDPAKRDLRCFCCKKEITKLV